MGRLRCVIENNDDLAQPGFINSYVCYDYDDKAQLIEEDYHGSNGARQFKLAYTYDADGNRLTKKYYNEYGDLTATLNFKGSGPGGAFDASNRLVEVSGTIGNRINVTGTVSDALSDIDRIWVTPNDDETKMVQAEVFDGVWVARGVELLGSASNSVRAIAYDDAGNTAMDMNDTITLETTVALYYKYDSKGNLIERGDGSDSVYLGYYQHGLQKKAYNTAGDTEFYYYDALGKRNMIVSYNASDATWDTRTFVYRGVAAIRELDGNNAPVIEYGLAGGLGGGIGSIVYAEEANDTLIYYTYNHKGDVIALVDEDDNIVVYYEYDAFGNLLTDADGTSNGFAFSTRQFSELSGLGHWKFREYDPITGRWTRLDPAGIIDGLNRYDYVLNNPINMIDPNGLDFLGIGGAWNKAGDALYNGLADAGDWMIIAYYDSTAWHFEGRHQRNSNLPTMIDEAKYQRHIWQAVPESMNQYHDNKRGRPETKFINKDGREAVYDGDTGKLVTDPLYMPTYNYVTPALPPKKWYDVPGWGRFLGKGAGHLFADMLPYYLGGNIRGADDRFTEDECF